LIVGGVAVCIAFAPVTLGGVLLVGAIGGAMIGAGFSGFTTDALNEINGAANDNAAWGKQLLLGGAIGAITGAAGGAAGLGIDKAFKPISIFALRAGIKAGTVKASTYVAKFGVDASLGAGGGFMQQVVTNVWDGNDDIMADTLQSTLIGGIGGGFFNLVIGGEFNYF